VEMHCDEVSPWFQTQTIALSKRGNEQIKLYNDM